MKIEDAPVILQGRLLASWNLRQKDLSKFSVRIDFRVLVCYNVFINERFQEVWLNMNETARKIVRLASIAVGVVLIVVFTVRLFSLHQTYKNSMRDGDLSIAEYQKELLVQAAQLEEANKSVELDKAGLRSMGDRGMQVATLQNQYVQSLNLGDRAQAAEIGAYEQQTRDIQDSLLGYIPDGDVSEPWFRWTFESGLEWNCVTNYDFYGEELEVMWQCTNHQKSIVYAFATGVYHVSSETFSDIQVYVVPELIKDVVYGGEN